MQGLTTGKKDATKKARGCDLKAARKEADNHNIDSIMKMSSLKGKKKVSPPVKLAENTDDFHDSHRVCPSQVSVRSSSGLFTQRSKSHLSLFILITLL